MILRGMVKKGRIQLDDPGSLPDGVEVEVRIVKRKKSTAIRKSKAKPRTLAERLSGAIGRAHGLPSDAAINHDHYLYGSPKQR